MGDSHGEGLRESQIIHLVQRCYGWPDSYILNDPFSKRDYISYTRWLEVVEEVVKSLIEDRRNELRVEAFGWWIYHQHQPRKKGTHAPTLDKWYKQFGLADVKTGKVKKATEVAKANANFNKHFGKFFKKKLKQKNG